MVKRGIVAERINTIYDVLKENHPISVRELLYTLEAKGLIQKTKTARDFSLYDNACREGRYNGTIPLEWIVDYNRGPFYNPGPFFEGVDDFWDVVKYKSDTYERDYWKDQPKYVLVGLEKVALASFYVSTCKKYCVRLVPFKGDSSYSLVNSIGSYFREALLDEKECYFLYLGDFNYRGYNIPRAFMRNLEHLCNINEDDVTFKRIAINFEHILRFPELPFNPNQATSKGKETEKQRFLSECRRHGVSGDKHIELEALKVHHSKEHLAEVDNSIRSLIDTELWKETIEQINSDREELRKSWEKLTIEKEGK